MKLVIKDAIYIGGIFSVFVASLIISSGQRIQFLTFSLSFLFGFFSTLVGGIPLKMIRFLDIKAYLSSSFLIGFFFQASLLMIMMVAFGMQIGNTLLILFFLDLVVIIFSFRIIQSHLLIEDKFELLVIVLITCICFICTYKYAEISKNFYLTGHLDIWSDYFIHGVTIASFGSTNSYGGSFELAGTGLPFYHYIGFMFPAVVMHYANISGLISAVGIMLPISILLLILGSYVLAAQLSSLRLGLTIVLPALFLPVNYIAMQSGWFDPYWLVFIAPGSGMGISECLLIVALLVAYDERNSNCLPLLFLLIFILALTRFHFFLLFFPLLLWFLFLRKTRLNPNSFIGINFILVFLAIIFLDTIPSGRYEIIEHLNIFSYINSAFDSINFYGYALGSLIGHEGAYAIKIQFILLAITGIYYILYLIILAIRYKKNELNRSDSIPVQALVFFILLMIFSPPGNNGDITEYRHRAFPLIYLIFGIYINCYVVIFCKNFIAKHYKKITLLFLSIAAITGWASNPAAPNLKLIPWAGNLQGVELPLGTLELADFLRHRSAPGDIFAVDIHSALGRLDTFGIELISLSGVPAYLVRSDNKRSKCEESLAAYRLEVLAEVEAAPDWESAKNILYENNIRWFVSTKTLYWKNAPTPSFSIQNINVYEVKVPSRKLDKNEFCNLSDA